MKWTTPLRLVSEPRRPPGPRCDGGCFRVRTCADAISSQQYAQPRILSDCAAAKEECESVDRPRLGKLKHSSDTCPESLPISPASWFFPLTPGPLPHAAKVPTAKSQPHWSTAPTICRGLADWSWRGVGLQPQAAVTEAAKGARPDHDSRARRTKVARNERCKQIQSRNGLCVVCTSMYIV